MELLYCKMAESLSKNEQFASHIMTPRPINSFEKNQQVLSGVSQFNDFTKLLDVTDSSSGVTQDQLNLSFYYQLVIILLKLRTKIISDKFLEKFNCKYLSYLFYSFNRGYTFW